MFKIRKIWTVVGILVMFAMIITACAPAATEAPPAEEEGEEAPPPEEEMSFEGETVTIFSACGEEQCARFQEAMTPFIEETGIDVVVEGSGDFEVLSVTLGEALGMDYIQQQYNPAFIESGTVDGTVVGIWRSADVKSLVWYPKPAFEAAGYTIPETWDELLALSDQIVADGSIPWCIGIESSTATGWPATDWIEDIMLRTTSPENYDAWTTGELKFDSPEVRNAFETMGNIFFNEDYVLGGTTAILTTAFGDAPLPLFDDPPSCYLHRQASFIPNFFPEGTVVGEDVDYFYLPPIDAAYGEPVLGSGNLLSMAVDNGAVREVMKFLATPESVEPDVRAGLAIAVQNGTPDDWYPSEAQQGFAQILANAETFRFDGSDLMPGAVGAGSFWTGVTDYIGGAELDTVLQSIDASWPSE
jgi:alpha-glucoside transport system substrate-binding protein